MSAAFVVDPSHPLSHLGRRELEHEVARLRALNAQLNENLTHTQARCTELLLEARAMAKLAAPTADALRLVVRERERQNEKWHRTPGEWPCTDGVKYLVLAEEVGEVAKAILEDDGSPEAWAHVREELVQVAAVAIADIETRLGDRS